MDEEKPKTSPFNGGFRRGVYAPILVPTSLIESDRRQARELAWDLFADRGHCPISLHQLRGDGIDRDARKPSAFWPRVGQRDEDEKEKLTILLTTSDGFKVAEEDLRLRGPGELAGVKQSGLPDFAYANLVDDFKIFECARDDATAILKNRDDFANRIVLYEAGKEAKGSFGA